MNDKISNKSTIYEFEISHFESFEIKRLIFSNEVFSHIILHHQKVLMLLLYSYPTFAYFLTRCL